MKKRIRKGEHDVLVDETIGEKKTLSESNGNYIYF